MYDPGYFTGGRLHPGLKARRPNALGWLLLMAAVLFAVFTANLARSGDPGSAALFAAGSLLLLMVGLVLLRRPRRRDSKSR